MKLGLTATLSPLLLLLLVGACSDVSLDATTDVSGRTWNLDAPTSAANPAEALAQTQECIPREERIRELQAGLDELLLQYQEPFPGSSEAPQRAARVICADPSQ